MATFIPLILQYGLPLAEFIWKRLTDESPLTQADWDKMRQLANQTATTQLMDAFKRNGIDPNSAKAQELLALIK